MDIQKIDVNKIVCKPALVYLVIALILLCVGILLKLDTFNITASLSQLSSIVLCTLVLMGICNIAPEISWIFVIIFILCTLSGLAALVLNLVNPNMQQH
jgi:hypothetical protein